MRTDYSQEGFNQRVTFLANATTKYAIENAPQKASNDANSLQYPTGLRSPYPKVVNVTMLKYR